MHIYIDESGIFRNPANKDNVASCVGALAIPTTKKKEVFRAFERLSYRWPKEKGEVKGKLLNETHVAALIQLLRKHEVIFELTAIDLGLHDDGEIDQFKQISAANFTKGLTEEHNPDLIKKVYEIRTSFEQMSNPLFIQAMVIFHLIPRILFHMVLYYARRIPEELQWFYWFVDAKEQKKTEFEASWSTIIFPIMTFQTSKNPIMLAEGGDYSYWKSFEERDTEFTRKIEEENKLPAGSIASTKLWEILGKHFTFQNSRWNFGLQMVDVLTNATQRALNQKLDVSGWGEIGRLMIRQKRGPVKFIVITPNKNEGENSRTVRNPFFGVMKVCEEKSKPVWRDSKTEEGLVSRFPASEDFETIREAVEKQIRES